MNENSLNITQDLRGKLKDSLFQGHGMVKTDAQLEVG